MQKFGILQSATAIVASLALAVGLSAPALATTNAADTMENSSSYTVSAPSSEDLIQARRTIKAEKLKDPETFNRKVSIIRKSPATMDYIKSYSGVNVDLQVQSLAGSMPLEPLTGFTEMLDAGVISFDTVKNTNGSFTVTVEVENQTPSTGDPNGLPVANPAAWPACASAWAAFWAWFATEGAMCGAFAGMPVAAVTCALGFGLGGLIVDFNAGC